MTEWVAPTLLALLVVPLVGSPHLDPVPELSASASPVTVSPSLFSGWSDLFDQYGASSEYRFASGNYRPWGKLQTVGSFGGGNGTAEQRRVFRHVSDTPPWKRAPSDQALMPEIDIWDESYWLFSGLTLNRPLIFRSGSSHNVAHQLLFDGCVSYCVRMHGNNCTAQRIYCRDQVGSGDAPAIQIEPVDADSPAVNNKVLDCEIRNFNDGVQISENEDDAFVPVDGTVIDGNDVYLTPERWRYENGGEYADAENAFDFKAGTDDADSPILVTNNRCWGFRYTAPSIASQGKSSSGACVTNHVASRNLLFANNIISDCPIGWIEHKWLAGVGFPLDTPRGTILRNNLWANIRRYNAHDDNEGGVMHLSVPVTIDGDRARNYWRLAKTGDASAVGALPEIVHYERKRLSNG